MLLIIDVLLESHFDCGWSFVPSYKKTLSSNLSSKMSAFVAARSLPRVKHSFLLTHSDVFTRRTPFEHICGTAHPACQECGQSTRGSKFQGSFNIME